MSLAFNRVVESYLPYGDNPFKMLSGKNLVFFDTETTGLKTTDQLTEIAAIQVNSESFQHEANLHVAIELNQHTLELLHKEKNKQSDSNTLDILNMTNYFQHQDRVDERAAIEQFDNFIQPGSVLIAHNAKFDLKMINSRSRRLGGSPIKRPARVLDTMLMSRHFFIPMSQELEMDGDATAKKQLDQLTKQWTRGGKRQKISSRLGDLSTALSGQITGWHEAMEDVKTTINIFKQLKVFFDQHFDSELKYNHDFIRRYKRARNY